MAEVSTEYTPIPKFNEALLAAMKEMDQPKRDSTADVGKFKYRYAQLDQVLGIIRPALFKHDIILSQGSVICDDEWRLITSVIYAPTGDTIKLDERRLEQQSDPQKVGSYETYMRRYALLTAFGLAAEDDDGQAAATPKQSPARIKKPAPANPKQAPAMIKKPADKIAEPTLKAIGETCISYAETFGINPQAFKQSVWEELQNKPEPEWLKKLSWMRSEIANVNERPVE